MTKMYLTSAVALGNGTRPSGFCIGQCDADGQWTAAESVTPEEIETVKRNPNLVTSDAPLGHSNDPGLFRTAATPAVPGMVPNSGDLTGEAAAHLGPNAPWRSTPTNDIPGLDPAIATILTEEPNNLATAGAIFDYGQANKGLTGLKEIGKGRAADISKCLAAMLQVEHVEDHEDDDFGNDDNGS